MTDLASHKDIILRWPSQSDFSDDIGVLYNSVSVMKHRNSIAPRYWPALIAAAQRRGFSDVTLELLLRLRPVRKQSRRKSKGSNAEQVPARALAG